MMVLRSFAETPALHELQNAVAIERNSMLTRGTQLGPYEILAPIGAGGMGEVYRARDSRLGRDVAVKIVPEHLSSDTDRLSRFEREARTVAALSHPNIVVLHDVGSQQGISFAVTELLEGETLRERLARGPLSCRRTLEIGAAIADGLAAAHAKGIVHRDLKPENIFLTSDGQVKILDFGLAHTEAVTATEVGDEETQAYSAAHTDPGAVLGTVGYMSPEQVRGEPVDARSDVFSLGCVFQEMIAGVGPFNRPSKSESLAAILHDEPPALPANTLTECPEVEAVVRRCMEKQREKRFQSARDLAFSLNALLAGSGESTGSVARRSHRVPKDTLLLVGVAVLVVAGIIIGVASLDDGAMNVDSLAVLPLLNISGDPQEEFFADGMTDGLIVDLAKIGSLKKVISYNSVITYKGAGKPLPVVARELGVNGIVEGTVVRVGERVRISVKLFHASTETPLWAEQYERDFDDVLALQSEVARAVAQAIQIRLTPEEKARLPTDRPVNARAYELCMKGRFAFQQFSYEGFTRAREYFELALREDPDFALAHAWIVGTYGGPVYWGWAPPATLLPARRHALLAVEKDPTLAAAHATLAAVLAYLDWDWPEAGRRFQRALELHPGQSDAYINYSFYLAAMNRPEEALKQMRRGKEVDPLNPAVDAVLGWGLTLMGKNDEATVRLEKLAATNPVFFPAQQTLWRAYRYQRLDEKAYQKARECFGLIKPPKADGERVREAMERGWAESAYAGAMLRGAEELVAEAKQKYVQPTLVALLYIDAGEEELALDWLDRAYEVRDLWLLHLVSRDWMSLRSHPRFQALLQRMKLPIYPPQ